MEEEPSYKVEQSTLNSKLIPAGLLQESRFIGDWSVGERRFSGEGSRHPERAVLYLCTACRFARLSISGCIGSERSSEKGIRSATGQRAGNCRILVLHHDVQFLDEEGLAGVLGEKRTDDRQEEQGKVWLASPESRLVQQSVSPAVSMSADLPEEENYAPAKWKYFVGGAEVCRDVFQKRLDRVYSTRFPRLLD